MMKKNIWIHVAMVVAMFAVACIYMAPVLGGKALVQGDQQKSQAMSYKLRMEQQKTGHIPNWESAMFSGMPSYQIRAEPQKSLYHQLRELAILSHMGWANNIGIIFIYLVGFYIAMVLLGFSPWLALVGALGFGLGSYNIIIIEAGHSTKAWAIAMMAPILAGQMMVMKTAVAEGLERTVRNRRVLWGSVVFLLALALQINFNHIQITFYTAIGCLFAGVAYLVCAIAKRRVPQLACKTGILLVCALLAVGGNIRHLMVNQEYVQYTMRGGNELTVTPDDLYHDNENQPQNTTAGLDIDYAFEWSYGVGETYTLLVPGAMGGGSGERVGENSSFYKTFRQKQAPLYWGEQLFTSGPVYFGAVLILLFLVGLVVVRGPERWWMLAAVVLSILLSWGSNFMGFNEWVFNHVPLYNKFRVPSMALVLASVCVALMAVFALRQVLDCERDRKRVNVALYVCTGVLTVLILVVMILSNSFDYSGLADRQMAEQYGSQWDMIKSVLVSDRAALLRSDSWRSLLFIVLSAAVLWLYNNDKLKKSGIALAAIGVLVVVDLWSVDRRYLNDDNFVETKKLELRRDQWDYDIDERAAAFGDHDFRVLNLAVNTFNDSKPAAFHDQVGGYSAAKLSRYQNLIDFYLRRHINRGVLNMLNARYIVVQNGQVQRNPEALGNSWFVEELKVVGSADDEILALNTLDPAVTAVVDTSKFHIPAGRWAADSTASIVLDLQGNTSSDYRRYVSRCAEDRLAVFSEIYYEPDWRAYVDGKPAEYIRVNYVLRAMMVPAGDHVVEFRNEAPTFHRFDYIGLAVSIVAFLAIAVAIVLCYRRRQDDNTKEHTVR